MIRTKRVNSIRVKQTASDKVFTFINIVFFVIVLAVVLYPIYLVVIASVSSSGAVSRGDVILFPREFSLAGYKRILGYTKLWRGYGNTLFYTIFGTAINLFMTVPAAYALSYKELVGRKLIIGLFLFAMMFNAGLIPTYLTMRSYGLVDTIWALVLPNAIATYNLMLCRSSFETNLPRDLWESAQLEGCRHTRFFISIALPLSKAIVSVMILYYAVAHWNAYFNALIYIKSQQMYPLQVILREILILSTLDTSVMAGTNAVDELYEVMLTMKYGVIIVSTIPIILLYLLVQKYFEKGIMLGAIKG